ncbi:hypothetical protein BCR24_00575 [Enterococcus ureilyticus]|uniref:Gram-positive cocci surface proteins LPxTG domain-containing protein n=1 Tax=Enterococcus ureilyticus TaxID=1131292 RepID=A0A1E5HGB1_9ENTE|nr:MucBP domain-containing protein [Enterococcus ureilyticus]MBM7688047.1 LPXTG-motif cell wall-anchored protein [Enterococcus ureilyticus]OEG23886.1 hypothetical protein BCR24_00575 [Enterococcus ureilyticus]
MKKWTHTLLVSTLVLGTVPYGTMNSSVQAIAEEIEKQEMTEASGETAKEFEGESLTSSVKQTTSDSKQVMSEVTTSTEIMEEGAKSNEVVGHSQIALAQENKSEGMNQVMPRNIGDFIITVDGVVLPVQEIDYQYTNAVHINFVRKDPDNPFAKSYQYEFLSGGGIQSGNNVDMTAYLTGPEGIYEFRLQGLDARGGSDTGYFANNIQRTASSINIDGVINQSETVVEDPSSIIVGRDVADTYGDYSYSWVIKDASGDVVQFGETGEQPDIDQLATGEYTITNIVTETPPAGYVSTAPITDTTSGKFKITAGKVIVEHILVDSDGNQVKIYSTDDTSYSGKIGLGYATTPIEITGYELVVEKMPANQNGTYTKADQTVKYYYKKVKTNINIEYVNEKGEPLSTGDIILGEYEDPYKTTAKDIQGYELVTTPNNATGNHTDKDQTVSYVYKKKATKVNVHYVDEKGKPLAESGLLDGFFDDPYNTTPKPISGYILMAVPRNASGKYDVDPTEVTYIYKKIEAPTVDDAVEGAKEVTGNGMPNSKVIVTFPDGTKVTVDVDKDGKWKTAVPEGIELRKGDKLTAVTLDPLTGTLSDPGAGKVTPLSNKVPETTTKPSNTSNTSSTQTKNKLPNTGETNNTDVMTMGLLSLVLAFFGKFLQKKKAE